MVLGYRLHSNGLWVCVSGSSDGLVQPVCAGLGAFDNAGDGILRDSTAARVDVFEARDLEHRPGRAI